MSKKNGEFTYDGWNSIHPHMTKSKRNSPWRPICFSARDWLGWRTLHSSVVDCGEEWRICSCVHFVVEWRWRWRQIDFAMMDEEELSLWRIWKLLRDEALRDVQMLFFNSRLWKGERFHFQIQRLCYLLLLFSLPLLEFPLKLLQFLCFCLKFLFVVSANDSFVCSVVLQLCFRVWICVSCCFRCFDACNVFTSCCVWMLISCCISFQFPVLHLRFKLLLLLFPFCLTWNITWTLIGCGYGIFEIGYLEYVMWIWIWFWYVDNWILEWLIGFVWI